MRIVIPGAPITKKNSQQILVNKKTGRPFISPSKKYKEYKKHCADYLAGYTTPITFPVHVKCIYYLPNARKTDLTNLMEATHDLLVHFGVLADDDYTIIQSVDGSAVYIDRENPRVEITIEKISQLS